MQEKILKIGHSPDADDAFMFYALAKGFVKIDGYEIRHVVEDIQSLNMRALKSELEVTAISAAVYPFIANDYWILNSGASVGRKYGPILVSKKAMGWENLKGKKIGIPGKQTTAFLLLKIFLEDFEPVEMDFKEVIPAVLSGKVEAGLVIHEGQLEFHSFGLHKCFDLGEQWFSQYHLPIPLGLDIVRKDIGLETAKKIQDALMKSIKFARSNLEGALEYAAEFGRGTQPKVLEKFIGMYVNEDTVDLGSEGKVALETLFAKGVEKSFFSSVPALEIIS